MSALRKFKECGPVVLSMSGVEMAFDDLGIVPPTLCVSKSQVGVARRLARDWAINYKIDKTLPPYAWYVEWRGKRSGSVGI